MKGKYKDYYHFYCEVCLVEEFTPSGIAISQMDRVRKDLCDCETAENVQTGVVDEKEPMFSCEMCGEGKIVEEVGGKEFCEECFVGVKEHLNL